MRAFNSGPGSAGHDHRLSAYRDTECFPLKLASGIAAVAPRGKGFFPRQLGKLLRPWIHHSIRTRGGALLPIVPEALDVYTSMLRQGGSWDPWVFDALNRSVFAGSVVYDVGANVGYISLELAYVRRADGVKVVSFEPQPDLAANIRLAAEVNGLSNLQVVEAAVGSSDGAISFFRTSHSVHSTALPPRERARVLEVRQLKIDSLVRDGDIPPPDFIKIDIEGYELDALEGARETIRRYRPWIVFEYSWGTIWGGRAVDEYLRFFAAMSDYELCGLGGSRLRADAWNLAKGAHLDIIARPIRDVK